MNSTFFRATLGFLMLSAAIVIMAMVGLWAVETYAGGAWWASLVIVIFALGAEVSVYTSTLHDPIYQWIKEPERERERQEYERKRHKPPPMPVK